MPRSSTNEVRHPGAELAALAAAVRCLDGRSESESAVQDAIDVLESRLGHDNMAVLVADDSSERLIPLALSDQGRGRDFVALDKAYVESTNPRFDRGVTGWVATHGVSLRLSDVRDDSRYLALRDNIRSELCVPIRGAAGMLGVINTETSRPNAFGETSQQVLELMASRLGPTLDEIRSQTVAQRSERLELLGQMTGGVAHDMNNLLTIMVARAELLEQAMHAPEMMQEHLKELVHTHELATSMTRALLDFARGYVRGHRLIDVNRVVRQAMSLVRLLLPPSVIVDIRLAPTLASPFADPGDVERLLLNLVLNARQAMPRGGNLSISTANVDCRPSDPQATPVERPGTHVRVSVIDNGEGMNEKTRSRLFRPLQTNRRRGHGLGLATVRQIVERCSGHIAVESERGVGTRFDVYLPCAASSAS